MEVVQIDKEHFEKLVSKVDEIHQYLIDKQVLRDTVELLTVQEVSTSLNVSESTIYRALRKNIISKDENGKLLPLDINEALLKKRIKCDTRFAEEFRRTYIYK